MKRQPVKRAVEAAQRDIKTRVRGKVGKLAPTSLKADGKTKVEITCRGADTAALQDLTPFQGELKHLSEESYGRLRAAILKYGFSFPFAVWKNKGKLFIEDGHQREKALRRMEQEGHKIPCLPIDYIEAKDEKEAKEKILLATSQYGDMTNESLYGFLEDSALNFPALTEIINLPGIDFEFFDVANFGPTNEEDQARLDISLAQRFIVPPFSVLDARQGYWQERKAFWIGLGIQSELGRGGGLLKFSEQVQKSTGGKGAPKKSYQHQKKKRIRHGKAKD